MKTNVIVYGLGKYFEEACENGKKIENYYNIVGYSDQNTKFADVFIDYIQPAELHNKNYDFIMVTSLFYKDIINDLVDIYHIAPEKILVWMEEEKKRDYFNMNGIEFAFGQFGEDYVIGSILKENGIAYNQASYIEVGVDEPFIRNHTYFLHLAGAKGILVDANPEIINLIKTVRKGQKIFNKAISDKKGEVSFYISTSSGLSSLDVENINLNQGDVKKIVTLEAVMINDILSLQDKTVVLSIDVEGYDETVLRTIDFERFRPKIICAEVGKAEEKLQEYMEDRGYKLVFCNYINSIWKRISD